MFEARLAQGSLLKKLIESIRRELVNEANFDVSLCQGTLTVCAGVCSHGHNHDIRHSHLCGGNDVQTP